MNRPQNVYKMNFFCVYLYCNHIYIINNMWPHNKSIDLFYFTYKRSNYDYLGGVIMRVYFLLILLCSANLFSDIRYITYEFSGGRMGDNLISYLHAKWIAYKYRLNLLYRPFDYSDRFMLHKYEPLLQLIEQPAQLSIDNKIYLARRRTPFIKQNNQNDEIEVFKENYRILSLTDRDLFKIPYFSDHPHEYPGGYFFSKSSFVIDWQDPDFQKILHTYLAPIEPLKHIIHPPEDTVSVALHVRNGGRFEHPTPEFDQLKFPPISFFIEQLVYVCKKYPDKKIYAFIITDSLNPTEIADTIAQAVKEFEQGLIRTLNNGIEKKSSNTYEVSLVFLRL